jgi:hypothetical protein
MNAQFHLILKLLRVLIQRAWLTKIQVPGIGILILYLTEYQTRNAHNRSTRRRSQTLAELNST